MKLLARQMAVVEMAKVWKKGDNFYRENRHHDQRQ